jgi:Kef-type K+ transport system membrane component KefB
MELFFVGLAILVIGIYLRRRVAGVVMRSQTNGFVIAGALLMVYGLYALAVGIEIP